MIGEILSRYRIISRIGAGGMGEVYPAEDTQLERQVALKVLRQEIADDEERVRRFVQEAKAASALNHPNILSVRDEAFAWREKDIAERSARPVVYAVVPELDELRDDPRFKEMRKRLNLTE